MIKKIIKYLFSPQEIRYAFISSSFINFASRILSYLRMAIIAYAFGISIYMDAYNVGHSLLEITVFIFGNSFDVLGIPQLVKALKEKGEEYFRNLSGALFSFSVIITVILFIFTVVFARYIINILVPGFTLEKKQLTLRLIPSFLPVMLTYIPYYALSAILKSIKRFRLVVLFDFLLSLISLVVISGYHFIGYQIIPLSLGLSYLIGFLLEAICVYKLRIIKLSLNIFLPEMKTIYHNMLSLSALFLIGQLYRVVDKGFGSFLPTGNISAIGYATLLISTIVTMFTFTGIFLTGFSEKDNLAEFFKKSVAMNLFISVPISIFIFFNAPEILQLLFQRGLFDKSATFLTGSLLSIYSLILFASLSLGVIYSFYQSQNKFKTIIIFSALGLALNAILNYIFLKPFGAKGIISATVISNYIIFMIGMILVCKYLKESLFRFTFNYLCFIGILALITALIVNFLAINIILKTLIYFLLTYSLLVLLDVPKPLRIKEMSFNAIKKYIKR